jgi:hypothetical protein
VGLQGIKGAAATRSVKMTNVRIFFPRILRIIVASPLDQVIPLSATALLAQNRLYFIVRTTPVCIHRRR